MSEPDDHYGQRPILKPKEIDLVALVFRFEQAALDRRLRACRIIATANVLDVASLNDAELDQALSAAAQAHAEVERAELCEAVVDNLRLKAFSERDYARRERVA